ncbi:MAG: hypothetical protein LN566_05690 [Rickettsia endosymbiont of Stiretrus anchorago]|nr:hypothetical protein [Rickettsia endosymbiont of Stiretrus anchorago]
MKNNEEEQTLMPEFEFDEEEEKRLKAENSRKELKVILITFATLLTGFIIFCYFFFNYMEEKAAEYKLQQEAEANKNN